jgi:hypothetical protein
MSGSTRKPIFGSSAQAFAIASVFGLLGLVFPWAATAGAPIWIPVRDARALSPLMTPASRVGIEDTGALGEFIVPMVTATAEKPAPD